MLLESAIGLDSRFPHVGMFFKREPPLYAYVHTVTQPLACIDLRVSPASIQVGIPMKTPHIEGISALDRPGHLDCSCSPLQMRRNLQNANRRPMSCCAMVAYMYFVDEKLRVEGCRETCSRNYIDVTSASRSWNTFGFYPETNAYSPVQHS